MELIEKIKRNIIYHMRPYNLGDNGETETLIMELIRRYESQHSVEPTLKKCLSCGAGEGDCYVWYPRSN